MLYIQCVYMRYDFKCLIIICHTVLELSKEKIPRHGTNNVSKSAALDPGLLIWNEMKCT